MTTQYSVEDCKALLKIYHVDVAHAEKEINKLFAALDTLAQDNDVECTDNRTKMIEQIWCLLEEAAKYSIVAVRKRLPDEVYRANIRVSPVITFHDKELTDEERLTHIAGLSVEIGAQARYGTLVSNGLTHPPMHCLIEHPTEALS